MSDMLLSAAIIVKDGERGIKRCIESLLPVCDEIVVVDTGSIDGTMQIVDDIHCARFANECAVHLSTSEKFFVGSPPGGFHFAEARNEAHTLCKGEWVITIDDDEQLVLDDAAPDTVRVMLRDLGEDVNCIRMRIPAIIDGQEQAAHTPGRIHRRVGMKWEGRIHERVIFDGERKNTVCKIAHIDHHYETKSDSVRRNRNLTMLRAAWYTDDDHSALFYLGAELLAAGCYVEAIGALEVLLAKCPKQPNETKYVTMTRLALCYNISGMAETAIKVAEKAVELLPNIADAYYALGDALRNAKRFDEATVAYESVRSCSIPKDFSVGMQTGIYSSEFIDAAILKTKEMRNAK